MPNTLAHIGINGLSTRALISDADVKWIYLGCILPDVPWILQRAVEGLIKNVALYDLRLYAIVQASLLSCLILAAGVACISTRPRRVFVILALGSLLHLLLDALQTKWANGVHLFAPLSWDHLNLGLFWPEDIPTLALTGFGLIYFVYAWLRIPPAPFDLTWPKGRILALSTVCFATYFSLPWAFMPAVEAADSHYVGTLRDVEARPGRVVEFDRSKFRHEPGGGVLLTWAEETIALRGAGLDASATVSLRGRFIDGQTVRVEAVHVHAPLLRDASSYLGLALILLTWVRPLRLPRAVLRG
jgi:hypothetical protein